jgi:hypothetical protein
MNHLTENDRMPLPDQTMTTHQEAEFAKAILLLHEHVKAYEQKFMKAQKRTNQEMKLYLESAKVINSHFEPDNLSLGIMNSTEKELLAYPAWGTFKSKV